MVKFTFSKTVDEKNLVDVTEFTQMLVQARKKAGLSQKEMAERLYIFSDLVEKIEKGAFGELTHLTKSHLKGFLKRYAELTKLDTDQLLDRFDQIYQESDPKVTLNKNLYTNTQDSLLDRSKQYFLRFRFILIVMTCVIVALLFFSSITGDQKHDDYQTIVLPN